MVIKLNVEKRDILKKKLKTSRAQGKLPAVLYGKKRETSNLFTELKDFKKIWKEAGETSVVELIEAGKKIADVLIHDTMLDPIKNEFSHVDFFAIEMDKLIRAHIPLVFVGQSPAEKELGGILVKVLHEIEIEALPNNLPKELQVDLSKLVALNDRIEAKSVNLPTGVTLITKEGEIIALVEEFREETVEPALTIDQIEVEKKGKKEEDVAEGVEGGAKNSK